MKLNPIRLIRLASQVLIMVAATLAVFGMSFTLVDLYGSSGIQGVDIE